MLYIIELTPQKSSVSFLMIYTDRMNSQYELTQAIHVMEGSKSGELMTAIHAKLAQETDANSRVVNYLLFAHPSLVRLIN